MATTTRRLKRKRSDESHPDESLGTAKRSRITTKEQQQQEQAQGQKQERKGKPEQRQSMKEDLGLPVTPDARKECPICTDVYLPEDEIMIRINNRRTFYHLVCLIKTLESNPKQVDPFSRTPFSPKQLTRIRKQAKSRGIPVLSHWMQKCYHQIDVVLAEIAHQCTYYQISLDKELQGASRKAKAIAMGQESCVRGLAPGTCRRRALDWVEATAEDLWDQYYDLVDLKMQTEMDQHLPATDDDGVQDDDDDDEGLLSANFLRGLFNEVIREAMEEGHY